MEAGCCWVFLASVRLFLYYRLPMLPSSPSCLPLFLFILPALFFSLSLSRLSPWYWNLLLVVADEDDSVEGLFQHCFLSSFFFCTLSFFSSLCLPVFLSASLFLLLILLPLLSRLSSRVFPSSSFCPSCWVIPELKHTSIYVVRQLAYSTELLVCINQA